MSEARHEGAEEAPDGPEDHADDAQGVGEPGGGRGPAAWRAWHTDGRRGTRPTALSTVSLSSRGPGLLPVGGAQEEAGEVPCDPEDRAEEAAGGAAGVVVGNPAGWEPIP